MALRFAIFGTGFWARFQLAAWQQVGGVECVAFYNRTRAKAERLAQEFGVPAVYDNPTALLDNERLDFVDIITDVDTHAPLTLLAAARGLPVICQKPMAPSLALAEKMVSETASANVPFFIHENFRWQTPLRALKTMLDQGTIGTPFRARIDFISGFPVFQNQPFLAELEQFILTDLGSHTLDVARFLFGEAASLYCQIKRVHPNIKGEDVATVLLKMQNDMTVLVEMAYAENFVERECFPQTLVFIEGERGTLELAPDFQIRRTTREGTQITRHAPPRYSWADPAYDIVHSSIVACNENLLGALERKTPAETTGADNLKTVRLVFGAYESALHNSVISL